MHYFFEKRIKNDSLPFSKRILAHKAGMPEGGMPLTIADMEFSSPPEIIDEMIKVAAGRQYAYCEPDAAFNKAVIGWMRERQGWPAREEDMVLMPGMISAAQCAVEAFTKPGDGILIHNPNYPPFFSLPKRLGRKEIVCELSCQNGRYELDLEGLKKAAGADAKMMILCSPHNPCGRVWSRDELLSLAEFCKQRGITLFADEIHADIILPGHHFVPFGSLPKEYLENVIIGTSAGKTFSLGGLATATVFLPNTDMKKRYLQQMAKSGLLFQSLFGLVATRAGYEKGGAWLDEMLLALEKNYQALASCIKTSGAPLYLFPLEGSYLAWLDCRGLGLSEAELMRFFWEEAGFYATAGSVYGGPGFVRVNLACPHEEWFRVLEKLEIELSKLVNVR